MEETNDLTFQIVDIKKLLKPRDVAAILNVSRSFTYQILQSGQLPVIRLGKSVRVRIEDVEAYIIANRVSGAESGK